MKEARCNKISNGGLGLSRNGPSLETQHPEYSQLSTQRSVNSRSRRESSSFRDKPQFPLNFQNRYAEDGFFTNGDQLDVFINQYSSFRGLAHPQQQLLGNRTPLSFHPVTDSLIPLSLQRKFGHWQTPTGIPSRHGNLPQLYQNQRVGLNCKARRCKCSFNYNYSNANAINQGERHPDSTLSPQKRQLPDPNFLITLKLIDPSFDLNDFLARFSEGGGHSWPEEELLRGLDPALQLPLRSLFGDQSAKLRSLEKKIDSPRGSTAMNHEVMEKLNDLDKKLRRLSKARRFDQFKADLFDV